MNDKIRVITLGGQDEFGKMLTIVEVNDDIFVIECGEKKPDKLRPGVDYIIANVSYLLENRHRIKAYFLTRGSDPAISGLPFVYEKAPAPIYCTDTTYAVLSLFMRHNKLNVRMDVNIKKPTDEFYVGNHRINFFALCASMSHANGVSIHTSYGNIMFFGAFVIDNDSLPDYYYDRKEIARLSEEGVLLLMCEARYADRRGYSNPSYKLVSLMEHAFKDAQGRIFLALETNDMYNIVNAATFALQNKKKIIFYDKETQDTYHTFSKFLSIDGSLTANRFYTIDTINNHAPQDIVIFMVDWGDKLYHKLALLASKDNPTKIINLNENDTIIVGVPYHIESEVSETKTIDMLYRSSAKVVRFDKKSFIRMHASEEDIKTILSITSPKYFVPIYGAYRKLLDAARVALSTSVGLTHNKIFVMDNGNYIDIVDGVARLATVSLPHGDVYVDGKGIGDITSSILEERVKFADDGVIIIGVTISRSKRCIVAGPDIQARGFVYLKDSEVLIKELTKLVEALLLNALEGSEFYNEEKLQNNIADAAFRLIRRYSLKNPSIIPSITILD